MTTTSTADIAAICAASCNNLEPLAGSVVVTILWNIIAAATNAYIISTTHVSFRYIWSAYIGATTFAGANMFF